MARKCPGGKFLFAAGGILTPWLLGQIFSGGRSAGDGFSLALLPLARCLYKKSAESAAGFRGACGQGGRDSYRRSYLQNYALGMDVRLADCCANQPPLIP